MNGLSFTWTWNARGKKESEAGQVRMVRIDEFYDVAEWFVMDDTDGDDDWCVIGETNTPDVVSRPDGGTCTRRRFGLFWIQGLMPAYCLVIILRQERSIQETLELCWRTLKASQPVL